MVKFGVSSEGTGREREETRGERDGELKMGIDVIAN